MSEQKRREPYKILNHYRPVKNVIYLVSVVLLLAGTSAIAADEANARSASTGANSSLVSGAKALDRADRNFVEKAAKLGKDVVIISQLAIGRATNPQVKEFAERVVADYDAANDKLAQLASTKSVRLPLPASIDKKWSRKASDVFDKDYIEKMIGDHQAIMKLFEKAGNGQDSDIASFAQARLPASQGHLDRAKVIKKSLK